MTDKGSKTRLAELAWPGLACWCVVATYFVYGSSEGVRGDPERWFVVPVLATWLVAIVYAFKSSRAEATKAVRTVSSVMNASATPIVPFMILTQGERLRGLSWIEEQLVSGVVAAAFILVGEGLWKPRSKAGRFVRMIWPAVATGVFYAGMRIVSSDAYVMALEPMRINEAAGAGWFWMTMASGLMVVLTPLRDGTAGQKFAASVVNATPVVFFIFFRHQQWAFLMFYMDVYPFDFD